MKSKWISMKRLKIHEFRTTSRVVFRDHDNWPRRYEALAELESRAMRQFAKICGQILFAYLTLTSLRSDNLLKVKIESFEASVPAAYFLATSSLLFLIAAITFCHLSAAMSLRIREGNRISIPGFSANMYGFLRGKSDELALGIPTSNNYFFKERVHIAHLFSLLILISLLSALIPLGAFGGFLIIEELHILIDNSASMLSRITASLGLAISSISFVYVVLFHVPLPTSKNSLLIRWGLLSRLTVGLHPRVGDWLDDK